MKLGLIARDDNRGLGAQSWEFYKHLKPAKTLVIEFDNEKNYREKYPDAKFVRNRIEDKDVAWLLDGIDVLLSFETFYNFNLVAIAKEKGVKTILQANYEWLDLREGKPDLYIAPSLWNYSLIPSPKVYLPVPINREVLPFQKRKIAKTFFCNVGNLKGGYDRNGVDIILKAIPLVKSKVNFILKSQIPISKINDGRVELRCKDNLNYWEGIRGDVLVYPRRYGGLSLPLNEAMSVGMAIIMPDIEPQNLFLPKKLLVKPKDAISQMIKQPVEIFEICPEELAKKIDEIANKDISEYKKVSNIIAEEWSWKKLKIKYDKIIKNI